MKNYLLTIFTISLSLWTISDADKSIIVHTNYGDILGIETNIARVFYGIPYAQPPVAELRWKSPVPVSKWAPRTINATNRAPACPQPKCDVHKPLCPPQFSEDCLIMNVFTPLVNDTSTASRLPVMIFIPGGSFQFLDASIPPYNAQRMVNTTNVICVFVQYRLGALGFLATGSGPDDLHGNYGILDQRLAIQWIKNNIDAFNGDPNQITLFGESAGAQSVSLHYVTDDMQTFFQGAIIESSPMTIPFRTYTDYVMINAIIAEQLHCEINNFTCYRNASFENVVIAQKEAGKMLTTLNLLELLETWVPVIDHNLVHGQPLDLIFNVSFPLKPLVIGTVTEEGIAFVYGAWSKPLSTSLYLEALLLGFPEHALKLIELYPPDGSDDQRLMLSKIVTDWIFACSTRIYAQKSPSYMYAFGYPPDFDGWSLSRYCKGHVCHGDELPYLFESAWYNVTDAGRRVSQHMATYWTNFAKTGDPTRPVPVPISWPVLNENKSYIYLQDPIELRENYQKEYCDFWDTIGYKHNFNTIKKHILS